MSLVLPVYMYSVHSIMKENYNKKSTHCTCVALKMKKEIVQKNSEAQFTSQTLQKCPLPIRNMKTQDFDTRILQIFSNYKPLWHYKDHI